MKSYAIDVNLVEVGEKAKGKALLVNPERMEIELPNSSGIVEHAKVTWTFRHLQAGLTPVITFNSLEVIASGPTTTLGVAPQVAFEIKFPGPSGKDRKEHPVSYKISMSGEPGKAVTPAEEPSLVIIRSPDPPPPPPSGGATLQATLPC